jgi:predicted kinase
VARARVLVVTGPPGAGKSTVARMVADRFDPAACVETDWFWTTIVRGHILPWLPEADAQNRAVLQAGAAAAARLAGGGYTVVVDGIIGPWYLDLVTDELWRVDAEVHYVVLRPRLEVAVARATSRTGDETVAGHAALTDEGPVRFMWERFEDLGPYERHVVDNGSEDPGQTADVVWRRFTEGADRLTSGPDR